MTLKNDLKCINILPVMAKQGVDGGLRAIIAAFFANLGIMVAKIIGFIFTGAASMLAEAVHSFADTSNQGLLIMGNSLAKRKETPQHPFGYGRERYFWAFMVALMIFSLGSLFAMYQGITKLMNPHEVESHIWAVGILSVAIVIEGISLRIAVQEVNKIRGKQSMWSFIKRSKVPELPVVLLEDLGALIGLVLALVGIGLTMITGDARFDAIGSLSIGILLGVIAIVLSIEMRSLLIGESATPETIAKLKKCIQDQPDILNLLVLKTQHLGPEELLVVIEAEFSKDLSSDELCDAINRLEERIQEEVPIAKKIYVEPDTKKEVRAPQG